MGELLYQRVTTSNFTYWAPRMNLREASIYLSESSIGKESERTRKERKKENIICSLEKMMMNHDDVRMIQG